MFDYAANFGGVYSLFLGMSVTGFLEVLYFLIVRLYANYQIIKDNDRNKKPPPTVPAIKEDLVNHF